MLSAFINETFQSMNVQPDLLRSSQPRDQLSDIKKSLFKEINEFRSNLSLPEFLEDHSINKVLENIVLGHSNIINPDDIITHLHYRISTADIQILTSKIPLPAIYMNRENQTELLKNCFTNLIREMIHSKYRERFTDPRNSNIAVNLGYDS